MPQTLAILDHYAQPVTPRTPSWAEHRRRTHRSLPELLDVYAPCAA